MVPSSHSAAGYYSEVRGKEEQVERPTPEQIQTLQKGREEEEGALDTGAQVKSERKTHTEISFSGSQTPEKTEKKLPGMKVKKMKQ